MANATKEAGQPDFSADVTADYEYGWVGNDDIDDALLKECSVLFSEHYGRWGKMADHPGNRIRLGLSRLREFVPKDGFAILARKDGLLIGHAFGVHVETPSGVVDWVTQLVVHTEHRHRGVAKDLLFHCWGFSDHFAWGLVTANPYTVRALEHMTHRRSDPVCIHEHEALLGDIGARISYVAGKALLIDATRSVIDTKFNIDISNLEGKLASVEKTAPWTLGRIREGEEWLAFTFRDQQAHLDPNELGRMLDHSARTVRQAYGRMKLDSEHKWMSQTAHEVDFALSVLGLDAGAAVLDLGCASGRHAVALAQRGYEVTGVDFVERFITAAKVSAERCDATRARFEYTDGRGKDLGQKYAAAICLYDVIGSFPEQEENQRLLDNIARHLEPGGRVLGSVLNMELTAKRAKWRVSIAKDPGALLKLPASKVMQKTGDIFDPDLFLLDEETGIVYRKEQFDGDGKPPGEYIVRDRRYTRDDVRRMCDKAGLQLCWARPVAMGRWEAVSPNGKEILFLAEKSHVVPT